jgi:nitroreductase
MRLLLLREGVSESLRKTLLPEKVLLQVLETGRWAPSAGNSQPWRFVVITDVGVKKRIALACTEFSRKA